jgi:hypothetical protein
MKGYSKICDVHYSLSQNELLIEVKENSTQKVHRLCKTLLKEVSVELSSVELLVDFIAVKLRKQDKDAAWDQLGYDITHFTLPKRGLIKSNFQTIVPLPEEVKQEAKTESSDKENSDSNN